MRIRSFAVAVILTILSGASAHAGPCPDKVFDAIFSVIVDQSQRGYVDNPLDHGGPTNMGVTQQALQAFTGKSVTPEDIRRLTRDEALQFYRGKYWVPLRCGDLPSGVDYLVCDAGVLHGVSATISMLEEAVGRHASGAFVVNNELVSAVKNEPSNEVIQGLTTLRLARFDAIVAKRPDQRVFLKGWKNRANFAQKLAMKFANDPSIFCR